MNKLPLICRIVLLRPLWLAMAGALLAACGASLPRVGYDYDPSFDFTTLKQFAWAEPAASRRPDDPLLNNSLVDDRIKEVIEHQLLLKGIRRASGGAPDFLVDYQVTTRKHRVASPAYSPYRPFPPYGAGFGYYGPLSYSAWDMPNVYWEEYSTYPLVVDFLHPATRKHLWRGILENALDLGGDPGAQKYRLDAQVQYLFSQFPPLSKP